MAEMTPQKALKVIDKAHDYPCPYGIGGTAWMYIRSCIEKQIPKKATEEETNRGIDISGEYDIDFHLCCPVCGAVVGTYEAGVNEYFENYCSNCGQAIDVSYSGCEEGAEE